MYWFCFIQIILAYNTPSNSDSVCANICAHAGGDTCVRRPASPSVTVYCTFWDRMCHWTWSLTVWLGCLARRPQVFYCPFLHCSVDTGPYHYAQVYVGAERGTGSSCLHHEHINQLACLPILLLLFIMVSRMFFILTFVNFPNFLLLLICKFTLLKLRTHFKCF